VIAVLMKVYKLFAWRENLGGRDSIRKEVVANLLELIVTNHVVARR
jgi:hypothetical protein